jgi:hypothetical protein
MSKPVFTQDVFNTISEMLNKAKESGDYDHIMTDYKEDFYVIDRSFLYNESANGDEFVHVFKANGCGTNIFQLDASRYDLNMHITKGEKWNAIKGIPPLAFHIYIKDKPGKGKVRQISIDEMESIVEKSKNKPSLMDIAEKFTPPDEFGSQLSTKQKCELLKAISQGIPLNECAKFMNGKPDYIMRIMRILMLATNDTSMIDRLVTPKDISNMCRAVNRQEITPESLYLNYLVDLAGIRSKIIDLQEASDFLKYVTKSTKMYDGAYLQSMNKIINLTGCEFDHDAPSSVQDPIGFFRSVISEHTKDGYIEWRYINWKDVEDAIKKMNSHPESGISSNSDSGMGVVDADDPMGVSPSKPDLGGKFSVS